MAPAADMAVLHSVITHPPIFGASSSSFGVRPRLSPALSVVLAFTAAQIALGSLGSIILSRGVDCDVSLALLIAKMALKSLLSLPIRR